MQLAEHKDRRNDLKHKGSIIRLKTKGPGKKAFQEPVMGRLLLKKWMTIGNVIVPTELLYIGKLSHRHNLMC